MFRVALWEHRGSNEVISYDFQWGICFSMTGTLWTRSSAFWDRKRRGGG